jgi:hypothetical protein
MNYALQRKIWSLYLGRHNPAAKLTLIYLFYRANHDDGKCWPSIRLIVRETGYSRRTVQRALRQLEDLGHVTRQAREGRSNVYCLSEQLIGDTCAKVTPTCASETPTCATATPRTEQITSQGTNPLNPPHSGGKNRFKRRNGTNLRVRGVSPRQTDSNPRRDRERELSEHREQWVYMGRDWKYALHGFFTEGFWHNQAYSSAPPGEKNCNVPRHMIERARALWQRKGAAI